MKEVKSLWRDISYYIALSIVVFGIGGYSNILYRTQQYWLLAMTIVSSFYVTFLTTLLILNGNKNERSKL